MDATATGGQLWPLTTGNNDNPTLTQGSPTSFFCNTVPDRCPSGQLAYYLPFVLLTISGIFTQTAGPGTAVPWDVFGQALIDSIDWINCWHGTPVSANHVKGAHLQIWEPLFRGYRKSVRQRNQFPAANGAYAFDYTVAIPASLGLGRLQKDTAQLALLFQNSQIKVNVAPASAVTSLSAGSTLTGLNARASAVLIPRAELVLGTPVEWILHQIVASTSSNQVQITGFGRDTMLTGVQNKAGVVFLGEISSNFSGSNGVLPTANITQFAFPWRGQQQLNHIISHMSMMLQGLPNDRPNISRGTNEGTTDRTNDFASFPYIYNALDTAGSNLDLQNLLYFPFVQGGNELDLTDVQTADRDETFFLTVNGGFSAGSHQIPALYAKAWEDGKIADWLSQVNKGGANSLAQYVIGRQATLGNMFRRAPRTKHTLTTDQHTYLPWQVV